MRRVLSHLVLTLLLAGLLAAGVILSRSSDPLYVVQEWLNYSRFKRFDSLIEASGKKYQVDPMLIKAIIWRESSFHPEKVGTKGERGLMQITPLAANEWAKSQKIQTFKPADLFDPKTNIEAGSWYIKQSLQRWGDKNDPVVFALAEYNAGHSNVVKWVAATKMGQEAQANDLKEAIKFPSTRSYVDTIPDRYRFYQKRGRL